MAALTVGALVAAVLVTSTISSIVGMAGGLLLMGVLVWLLPVGQAMILHGIVQTASNGYRAWLHRERIARSVLLEFTAGAALCLALFMWLAYVPDRAVVFLALGAVPFVAAAIPARHALDATRRGSGVVAGLVVTAVHLMAGVAGPLLDVFFVKSRLGRHEVVATKAVVQTIGHIVKIVYFAMAAAGGLPVGPGEVLLVMVLVTMAFVGTALGKRVLDRMSDLQFRTWSQRIVLGLGAVYLVRGALLLLEGPA